MALIMGTTKKMIWIMSSNLTRNYKYAGMILLYKYLYFKKTRHVKKKFQFSRRI